MEIGTIRQPTAALSGGAERSCTLLNFRDIERRQVMQLGRGGQKLGRVQPTHGNFVHVRGQNRGGGGDGGGGHKRNLGEGRKPEARPKGRVAPESRPIPDFSPNQQGQAIVKSDVDGFLRTLIKTP